MIAVLAVVHQVFNDLQNSLPNALFFFLGAYFGNVVMLHRRLSRVEFTAAWRRICHQASLIDQLRQQAITDEMKNMKSGEHGGRETKIDGDGESDGGTTSASWAALQSLISTSGGHPWPYDIEGQYMDTVEECTKSVGAVPSIMPKSWQCFVSVVERTGGVAKAALVVPEGAKVVDDLPELLVSGCGLKAVQGMYTRLLVEDIQDPSPTFILVTGELSTPCYIRTTKLDKGFGDELVWGIFRSR